MNPISFKEDSIPSNISKPIKQVGSAIVCDFFKEIGFTESILLCPGFTLKDVVEIFEALESKVAVYVSRGDGPGSKITAPVLQREFFGK
jgi:hypothetical protein